MLTRHTLFRLRNLLHAALAIAACTATSALAQGNAANGATLYAQKVTIMGAQLSCQDCHGFAGTFRVSVFPGSTQLQILARINSEIGADSGGMSVYSTWTQAQLGDVAAHILAAPVPPLPPPNAPLPTPTASPNTVMFGSTAVGATSPTVTVLMTNGATNAATITLGNPAVTNGTGQVGDFRPAAPPPNVTACTPGLVLNAGMSCSIGAQFVPTAAGARTATWNVNFVGSPSVPAREVTLQGTATGTASAPTSSANAPLNAGAGALGWMNLLGLLALLGVSRTRRR
jgi:mono/diheme cytochrome c family protein